MWKIDKINEWRTNVKDKLKANLDNLQRKMVRWRVDTHEE